MRAAFGTEVEEKLKPRQTPWEVTKRIAIGVYNDGFMHAGNCTQRAVKLRDQRVEHQPERLAEKKRAPRGARSMGC